MPCCAKHGSASGYDSRLAALIAAFLNEIGVILYEYPFNERVRTYLRLEHLFKRLGQLVMREHALDHHYALSTIFEVMDVAARADLKSDVLRDLEKQKAQLAAYQNSPSIDQRVLGEVVSQLDQCFANLNATQGKAGQTLTENEWLMSVRSRAGIPGGTCEFDLPAYYAWQHHSSAQRQHDLAHWSGTLAPLADAIYLLLKLLRDSGTPQKVVAAGGQLQQPLSQGRSFNLLRLRIDENLGLVPEISGNRLMVSVRLMRQGDDNRLHPDGADTEFELALCA
jgi:cell division protein ZapD